MATMRQGSLRASGLLLATAVAAGLLAACTPRTAYASLENRTGDDVVVLSTWYDRVGSVPAGGTDSVEVGIPGDCLEGLLVLTADLQRLAVVDGPVCEHDDVAVETADLVAAGSVVLRNETGIALSRGWLGGLDVGALGIDEELVVPLAVPEGGCAAVSVRLIAVNPAGDVTAEAEVPGLSLVCDGRTLALEPWTATVLVDGAWVPVAPSPPAPAPATATFTNGAADVLQLVVDGDWQDAVAPGEATVAAFAASAAGCATVPVRALIGPAGTEVPPFTGILCDGAQYVVAEDGFEVVAQGGEAVGPGS